MMTISPPELTQNQCSNVQTDDVIVHLLCSRKTVTGNRIHKRNFTSGSREEASAHLGLVHAWQQTR